MSECVHGLYVVMWTIIGIAVGIVYGVGVRAARTPQTEDES